MNIPNCGVACKNHALRKALTLALLASSASLASATSLVLNGSFEGPGLPGDGIYQFIGPSGWGGGSSYFIRGSLGGVWPSAKDGFQFVDITGGYTIYQNISVATAGSYLLTWYDNTIESASYSYNMYLGGSGYQSFIGTGSTAWNTRSLTLNLSAGLNVLAFNGLSGDTFLDNISLEAVSTSVPETGSTLTLMAFSISALAFVSRKLRGHSHRHHVEPVPGAQSTTTQF